MTTNQTRILKSVLLYDALCEVKYYETLPIKTAEYSEGFKRKIEELMNEPPAKKHTASKKLVFILVAAILSVLLFVSASAIAIKYRESFVNIYERFIEIVFLNENDQKNTIKEIYTPTYIPYRYTLTNQITNETTHRSLWSNGELSIVLDQKVLNSGSFTFDNESNEYESFVLDGKTIYYYTKYNTIFLIWSSEKYVFSINCSSDIPLDEIKLMISSMSLDNSKTD